ncbi:MAG: hypothetical protein E7509_00745 [Ruminococcus sp.]|nr:hypothetical protein [Ruminococcus sp.]
MNIRGLVLLLILTAFIFLTGCSDTTAKRPDLNSDYQFEATVNFSNEAFTISGKKTSERWVFTYIQPAEIKDMSVVLENDKYKISYNGLIQEGERSSMPDSNVCDFVARSLEYIARGKDMEFSSDGDIVSGKGVFDGGDLKVTYNKNRLPEEITIGKDIEIIFKSFKKVHS